VCTCRTSYALSLRSSHNDLSRPFTLQPSCRAPADPYVEHDPLVVALDLILLKRGVYRHLLFNRGTPPRKVDQTARNHVDGDGPQLQKEQQQSTEEGKRAQDRAREMVSAWFDFCCFVCSKGAVFECHTPHTHWHPPNLSPKSADDLFRPAGG
jgi:hypothetical protein